MEDIIPALIDSYIEMFYWLCGLAIGCSLLELYAPCNPHQPRFRNGIITDILYYFIVPFLGRIARMVFVAMGVYVFFHGTSPEGLESFLRYGYGPLSTLPLWLQAAMAFILSDIAIYWMHRWFHGKRLWRFHAIHHSSPHVDWLSTYRFHPINTWIAFSLVDVSMLFIGFSPAAVGQMVIFNTIYSALVHTNVNWTFGPFKYVFASPVFHRWHHTSQAEGMDKNFAPTFPLLDIIFGTFYMPDNTKPEHFGVDGSDIPNGFLGQMIWPFKKE
jgi:sterol desaturase/sphingolipid hydroxylase (fatty acid hydroxylase superfamily)